MSLFNDPMPRYPGEDDKSYVDRVEAAIRADVARRLGGLTGEALRTEAARMHAEDRAAMTPSRMACGQLLQRAHREPDRIPGLLAGLREAPETMLPPEAAADRELLHRLKRDLESIQQHFA